MADKILVLNKDPASASNTVRLIKDDNDTFTIQFVISRYWGSVDLNTLTWSVNLKTANNEKYYYPVSISDYDDDNVYVTWTVKHAATIVTGKTFYTVEGKTSAENPPVWRSSIQTIDVAEGIGVGDIFDDDDATAIEVLIEELRGVIDDSVVRFDITQSLTDAQKLTARNNIGAESSVSNNTLILA